MGSKEREEARKEVKVLSRLKHPNIVSYQESFEDLGNLHIIMDYCEAGDLYQRIVNQKGAHFPESQVLDWFVQLCLALKHIHDRKILHRDIKSQNIFLTRHSIVKLGDFGIARVLKNTMELARTCIGTPYYLSPEICENRPYNNKSDVWSLGCVLYELTTLKHPFEAGNMKNLVLKIIRGSYPPVPSRYSGDVRALVAHCFKRIPSERPSVSAILRKPFVQNRIKKFLSPEKIEEEFNCAVLPNHPAKVEQRTPKLKQAPPRAPVAGKRQTDLAAIYGVSVAKRPAPGRKPAAAGVKTPEGKKDRSNEQKKQLDARERRRKEMEAHRDVDYHAQMKRAQQQRWQKQQIDRINKARETGWKSVLGNEQDEEKPKRAVQNVKRSEDPQKYNYPSQTELAPYSADEKQDKMVVDTPCAVKEPDRQPKSTTAAHERAQLVQDYWQRKNEAAANKARGNVDIFGNRQQANNVLIDNNAILKKQHEAKQKDILSQRQANAEQKNYLAQLEAIRRENYYERRGLRKRNAEDETKDQISAAWKGDPRYDPEARKQKILALKEQAEQRAELLRKQLEARRQAAALKYEEESRSKRVAKQNAQHQQAAKHGKDNHNIVKLEMKPQDFEFAKADIGTDTAISQLGRHHLFRSCSEGDLSRMKEIERHPRKVWKANAEERIPLAMLPLEQTASKMEATANDERQQSIAAMHVQRRQWGSTGKSKVISVLNQADISDSQQFSTLYQTGFKADAARPSGTPVKQRDILNKDGATYRVGDLPGNVSESSGVQSPLLSVTVIRKPQASIEECIEPTATTTVEDHQGDTEQKSISDSAGPTSVSKSVNCNNNQLEASSTGELCLEMAPLETKEESLFSKSKEPQSKSVVADDLVIVEELEDDDECDESFHTANGSADLIPVTSALKTGLFDTQKRLLKTCSLPDLSSSSTSYVIIETPSKVTPSSDTTKSDSPASASDTDNSDNECEELQEIADSDNEVQDFEEMINSMKDLLSHPAPSPITKNFVEKSDDENDKDQDSSSPISTMSNLNEDWDSDDGDNEKTDLLSSTTSNQKDEKRLKFKEELFTRIEESRSALEDELGLDRFIDVYQYFQKMQDSDNDEVAIGGDRSPEILDLLGTDKDYLYQKILYLVMAESAYCEDNE